jgi:hypothetical protein
VSLAAEKAMPSGNFIVRGDKKDVQKGTLVLGGTWFDHYAETAMYLRLNGVSVPATSK